MKTVRRPPYPKWNPGYFPCSSLTPLPLSSRRPSVSFGGFGLNTVLLTFLAIELLDELVFGAREAAWPLIRTDLDLTYLQIGVLLSVPAAVAATCTNRVFG